MKLIKIDKEKFIKVVKNYLGGKELLIIENLQDSQDLQIEFLKLILNDAKYLMKDSD